MAPELTPQTERFLNTISGSVRTILARRFPRLPAHEREDVEQEVKLKFWKMLSSGKKIDRLESYLWKVVYTTALDLIESRLGEVPLEEGWAGAEPSVGPEFESLDRHRDLQRLLDDLPPKRRMVLKLYLAGMDLEEAAAHLGWSRPKVRHLFYRGVEDLRGKLNAVKIVEPGS